MLCLGFSGCFLACTRCQPHYALSHQFRFYARYLWFQETLHTKGSHLQWHREGCTHLSPIAINKIHPQKFWLIKKVQAFIWKWIFHKVNLSPGCWLCRWNTCAKQDLNPWVQSLHSFHSHFSMVYVLLVAISSTNIFFQNIKTIIKVGVPF